MDIFAQKRVLVRIVILLTVLNLCLIGVFLWKDIFQRPPKFHPPNENRDVSSILMKELHLSREQAEQIKALRVGFFEQEQILSTAIRSERDSLNQIMFNKVSDEEVVKSLARQIADNDYKMEFLRYDQSKKLKSICTSDQLERFEHLVREIRDYFKPEPQLDINK